MNNVAIMADLENNITFEKIGLTLKIKVNHQGQVTDFGFSEIRDIVNVRMNTKIESIACIQPKISKVIGKMCMTLSSKFKRLKYVNYFNIFDISGLEMLESIQRSCLYDVYNQRYERSYTNDRFSRSTIKVR